MPFSLSDAASPAAPAASAPAPASPGSTAGAAPAHGFTLDEAQAPAAPGGAAGVNEGGPDRPRGPIGRLARGVKEASKIPIKEMPGRAAKAVGGFVLDTLADVPKEIGREYTEGWNQLKADFQRSRHDYGKPVPESYWGRLKEMFDEDVAKGATVVDAFNLAVAPLTGATTALVSRPISKVTGIPEGEVDKALFALAPEKGLRAKIPAVPGAASVKESWVRNIQPELMSDDSLRADPLFAKYAANRAQNRDQIVHAAQGEIDRWDKVPDQERLNYMLDMETGAASGRVAETPPRRAPTTSTTVPLAGETKPPPLSTIKQKVDAPKFGLGEYGEQGQRHRKLLDQAYRDEKEFGSKAAFVDEYFPHLWKDPAQAKRVVDTLHATLGPRWFQKARTYDLILQGIHAGLELKSTNPEVLVMHRLLSGADMRTRMELLRDLRGMGLAAPVKAMEGATPNRGWFTANAPNGDAWILRDDIGPLWKNAVEARGLWANEGLIGDSFRAWMTFKNVWVPIKLSLSMFHPVHILHINFSNNIARSLVNVSHGNIGSALRDVVDAFNIFPAAGREARAAWLVPRKEQTALERGIVDLMVEGGFSPQLSEQLRIAAARNFKDALANQQWFRLIPLAVRRGIEVMQAPIFEKWIPNLKANAYLNEARSAFTRNPGAYEDAVQRGMVLRTIAKSIDNRFGEMFYSSLFWNRTMKDAGIGLFLSLSWNTGFIREFGGGFILDPLNKTRALEGDRALLRDVRTRTAFASVYTTTAMVIAGIMTYALSGKPPSEWLDYIFPTTGETNPDGSKHRLSTPMFTREIPQLIKHKEEANSWVWGAADMLYNKLMVQPFVEMYQNKDYWGYDIADVNAPVWDQARQILEWVGRDQFEPITVGQARRSGQSGADSQTNTVLSFMGFGPAPSYAARSEVQNRIESLYARHVAPPARPHDARELAEIKRDIKGKLMDATQHGDNSAFFSAVQTAASAGLTRQQLTQMGVPSDIVLFRALPVPDQLAILRQSTPEELRRYGPFSHAPVRVELIRGRLNPPGGK